MCAAKDEPLTGQTPKQCRRGHADTYYRQTSKGLRLICRTCRHEQAGAKRRNLPRDWTPFQKVMQRVEITDSCWLWTGPTYRGYGVGAGGRVHRVVYEAVVGPIPEGLVLDHLCRVRHCVNPDHLEPVTVVENTLRSPTAWSAVNARKTHCKHGHEFTEANTYWRPSGGRRCLACKARLAVGEVQRRAAARLAERAA